MSTAVVYGDPVLRQPADPIEEIDAEVHKINDLMVTTLRSYGSHGAAIAANQVGCALAMFVYWDLDSGDPRTVINPSLTLGDGRWDYSEGCLSLPGVYSGVVRPNHVLLTGLDLDGQPLRIEASEFLGRVFQHEYDHLQGKLFIDKVPPGKKREAALRKLKKS
jgi:peptide deformylase